MLQRVAAGQVRFNVAGLTADGRGVAVGRQMMLRFSALDRLVSFLRLWSAEQALDDLQPSLRLMQARTPGGTREALVLLPVSAVAQADGVARVARTAGGQCFTGAGKQFVQYRDQQAPLGYDVTALEPVDDAVDFVLYGQDVTLGYAVVADLPLQKLLLRLDLQRDPHAAVGSRDSALPTDPAMREALLREALLMVRRGLGPMVIAYLHRAMRLNANLRVSAALCEPADDGSKFQRRHAFWILRVEELPPRLWGVLSRTPGLTLLNPVADNVAVAVGYRHPIHLGSCKQAFPAERLFLFGPPPEGVTVVAPVPVFSPIADLVRLQTAGRGTLGRSAIVEEAPIAENGRDGDAEAADMRPHGRVQLTVPLRLEAASVRVGRAVAALVPWAQVGWIRSLCYALPPSVLRGYRVAFLARGPLIVAPDALDGFPFGRLFHAPAPTLGLLVPLGWELRPAVSPDELAARVGATAGALVVFPGPDEPPFRIPADAVETLEARVLSDGRLRDLRVEEMAGPPGAAPDPTEIDIENQPLGPMPLWRLGR